ncbi:hypothetical protein ACKWTF_001313 [Chironomus riparius]
MNKTTWGSIFVVVFCILLTQGIAFAFRADNRFTLSYIALYAIGFQWVVFIHAGGFFGNERTEKYYDIVGSITFITTTIINSVFSKHYNMRTALLNTLVIIWTVRLGAFLFIRIHNNNGVDARFTELKQNNWQFLMTWTLQGVWVFMTLLPLLIMAQKENSIKFNVLDYIGISLFIVGFLFETIADYQKFQFRLVPENKDLFINSGLWKYSRHPNYFGEILLWLSFSLIAFSGSKSYGVFISPVFVALLLIFVSGIPLLEKRADAKFGDNEDYLIYKKNTPVLIPLIGCAGNSMF